VDLTAGYRFDGPGVLGGTELQVNVTNLFDKTYIGSIGTNGFGYSGDNMTLQAGAPRQVFVTLRKDF
jgi:iron complex outermembrane receptor protein